MTRTIKRRGSPKLPMAAFDVNLKSKPSLFFVRKRCRSRHSENYCNGSFSRHLTFAPLGYVDFALTIFHRVQPYERKLVSELSTLRIELIHTWSLNFLSSTLFRVKHFKIICFPISFTIPLHTHSASFLSQPNVLISYILLA